MKLYEMETDPSAQYRMKWMLPIFNSVVGSSRAAIASLPPLKVTSIDRAKLSATCTIILSMIFTTDCDAYFYLSVYNKTCSTNTHNREDHNPRTTWIRSKMSLDIQLERIEWSKELKKIWFVCTNRYKANDLFF